jgi:hypothetical protein
MSDVATVCQRLMELRVQRDWHLRNRNRIDLNGMAMLRRALTPPDADSKARERAKTQAMRVWSRIVAGKPVETTDAVEELRASLAVNVLSRKPQQQRMDEIGAEMVALAKTLPAAGFVDGVRGFSLRGLAALVGEAGDLAGYPNPRHVWKRMGLMPWNGHAGSQCGKLGLSKDEWKAFGYVKRRRATVRAEIEEPLFFHQIESAEKSGTEFGRPRGRYGEVYVRRREFTRAARPDWTKGHAKDDATRVMAKALISDLWSEWRGKHKPRVSARLPVASPAELIVAPAASA